ncbi:MAG: hypothetical protein M0Q38_01370 [Bacteroidales bacterium]|jgi:NDP-sugar pyrophosphorylase family protein|nr:hypothetical protein [Bacteroidales bacterium]
MIYLNNFIAWKKEVSKEIWRDLNKIPIYEIVKNIEQVYNLVNSKVNMGQLNTYIAPTAIIGENVYIGNNCQIYDYACIRDNTILLDNVVVGHCSEIARSIVFSNSKITHKVTMSDCVVGREVNIGASVSLASPSIFNKEINNLKKTIKIPMLSGEILETGLVKFGSIIGDSSRIAMNSSCGPGVLLGRRCFVYPNVFLRGGQYGSNIIIKTKSSNIEIVPLMNMD